MKKGLLLGAGFSYDLGMPLASELTEMFLSIFTPRDVVRMGAILSAKEPFSKDRPINKKAITAGLNLLLDYKKQNGKNYEALLADLENLKGIENPTQSDRDSSHFLFGILYEIIHKLLSLYQRVSYEVVYDRNREWFRDLKNLLSDEETRHWNRISDILRVDWDDLDLPNGIYRMYIGKKREIREKPIDGEVLAMLANEPVQVGRLFPWRTKERVYRWLRPLTKQLGIKFTPHMARHYGGKLLNWNGEGLKTIMGALDHSDAKSSLRYQDADQDIIREAMERGRMRRETGVRPQRLRNGGGSGSAGT